MRRITVGDVLEWLDGIAPFETAEAYDNVGLLVGDRRAEVQKVLFCVDATPEAAEEAARLGAGLIVTHHPLMFGGISHIDYAAPEGKTLRTILREGMSLIAAHTNLDKSPGGIADSLAEALGLQAVETAGDPDSCVRVGFLPVPMGAEELAGFVAKRLRAEVRRFGAGGSPVKRAAVGPGAGGGGAEAALGAGAQCYVVGEIKHHELLLACGQGLLVLEAGHYATEAAGMEVLYKRFQAAAVEEQWNAEPLLFAKAPFLGALRPEAAG